jgi:uncharacterized protein (DUF2164 family)
MRKWRRVALQGIVWLTLIWGVVWTLSNRAEISEAFEVATCRAPCLALKPDQLRLQVIKAYLHRELERNIELNDGSEMFQLALVPRDMTAQDMAQGIRDASLLGILTSDTSVLKTHAHIDALNIESLARHPSIAVYFLRLEYLDITPTRSIRKASMAEVENYFRAGGAPAISSWERQRGYGGHFFWLTDWYVDVACCDGHVDSDGRSSRRKNDSLGDIESDRPRLMAVSNRGVILIRYYDGESFIFL